MEAERTKPPAEPRLDDSGRVCYSRLLGLSEMSASHPCRAGKQTWAKELRELDRSGESGYTMVESAVNREDCWT